MYIVALKYFWQTVYFAELATLHHHVTKNDILLFAMWEQNYHVNKVNMK